MRFMKYILLVLVLFSSASVFGQQHNFYADAGLVFSGQGGPVFSATYNYRPVKHIGLGLGVQGCKFRPTYTTDIVFMPTVFGEFRVNIRPEKKNQFFTFIDFGMNFYKHSDLLYSNSEGIYEYKGDNGFYFGLGLGYFRPITERGWGPYASIRIISNAFYGNAYYVSRPNDHTSGYLWGDLAFSVGFKF